MAGILRQGGPSLPDGREESLQDVFEPTLHGGIAEAEGDADPVAATRDMASVAWPACTADSS